MRSPTSILRALQRKAQHYVQQPDPRDLEKVFFLHFPKCGGTSVDLALRRMYSSKGAGVAHLDIGAWSRASKAARPYEGASQPGAPYRRRLMLYMMEQPTIRYLSGHFGYTAAARDQFEDEWNFIALLREPVSRWFSEYFYNKYKTQSQDFNLDIPLEEFIETRKARRGGVIYVRNLVDNLDIESAYSEENIQRAIENLQRFSIVGMLDQLNIFRSDFERRFGVSLDLGHHNRSPRSRSEQQDEMTPEIMEKVQALCVPNTRLYEAVRTRIEAEGSWLIP